MDNIEVRPIRESEYAKARLLWDACFPEDADGYSEWYFTKKTKPEYVYAAFERGEMLSCLHALPYPLAFTNGDGGRVVLPCAMVAGVATYERFRHRGLAAQVIRFAHAELYARGVYAALLKPDVDFYGQFGYMPFSYHAEYEYTGNLSSKKNGASAAPHEPTAKEALEIYSRFAKNFEGMMARTERDMALALEEARLSGFAWTDGVAYALGAETEYGADISELAGEDIEPLVRTLGVKCARVNALGEKCARVNALGENALGGKYGRVSFRLPRGVKADFAKKTGEVMFSMLCPINEEALLEKTGARSIEALLRRRCATLEFC